MLSLSFFFYFLIQKVYVFCFFFKTYTYSCEDATDQVEISNLQQVYESQMVCSCRQTSENNLGWDSKALSCYLGHTAMT